MLNTLPIEWHNLLNDEINKPYFIELQQFISNEYKYKSIFPNENNIYRALEYTKPNKVKIVILGQDPYHQQKQANGLAFSVDDGIKLPPSLKNIFKELYYDLGVNNINGDLSNWAKQGVLLLNTSLTVEENKANSHSNIGWNKFTDAIITLLNNNNNPIVFMLWGNNAISKKKLINNPRHLILTATHPSPLSAYRGFFHCKHFSKANEFLINNNIKEIDWDLSNNNRKDTFYE